jgi:hypothetical protein
LTYPPLPGSYVGDVRVLSRESRPGLRILYMSGYTADVIASSTVLDPGVGFLSKPFKEAALTRRVREVLDGKPTTLD